MRSADIRERFYSLVGERQPDACWPWQGSRTNRGYGRIKIRGRQTGAHRLSYRLHNGPFPAEMLICHRCDNPPYVNPAHLFLGTAQDNSDDATRKGRSAFGERNGMSRPEVRARHRQATRAAAPLTRRPGALNGGAKLSEDEALAMRAEWDKAVQEGRAGRLRPVTTEKIAAKYGVSLPQAYRITRGQSWIGAGEKEKR